jgi:Zn-dependent protease
MHTSITFGHAAGIPLKIHLNWFITAVLVSWSLAAGYFPHFHSRMGKHTYWFWDFDSVVFFGSVLLHELGHSLVALSEGVGVNSITFLSSEVLLI